ncbi:MAG: (2Fe-2S) ferredoxin domain-containing protein [Thermomicrobiales bacterium]
MYWTKHHVLCCTASHCTQKGANDVIMQVRREVMRRGLESEILVNTCGTIDLCDIGPNIVVYPEGVIYSGVTTKDVKDLIGAIAGGEVLDRLVLGPESEAEQARRGFYAEIVSGDGPLPATEVEAIAATRGFAGDWLGEQARRGFVARKPGVDGAPETIAATKKARDRYRI